MSATVCPGGSHLNSGSAKVASVMKAWQESGSNGAQVGSGARL
jgi:hypothetical protein